MPVALQTIVLLIISNVFMTFAWYGHLKSMNNKACAAIVLALRGSLGTALTASAALAQIGEFSFILIGLGVALKLVPPEGQNLVVAGALLSITLNPLVFYGVDRWLASREAAGGEAS